MMASLVFRPVHYFASKSFAAVREAFRNAHPDSEVPYKTAVHRLVTKFQVNACVRKKWWTVLAYSKNLFFQFFSTKTEKSSLSP
jgi:hypothetical protein